MKHTNLKKKTTILLLCVILCFALTACSLSSEPSVGQGNDSATTEYISTESVSESMTELTDEDMTEVTTESSSTSFAEKSSESSSELSSESSSEMTSEKSTELTTEATAKSSSDSTSDSTTDFDFADIPPYSGEAFITVNDNVPFFSDEEKKGGDVFETYSELDELGRCGIAYANLCKELMPTEERGEIGDIRPSGWHTVKYNELIDGNYLYNRCHLIAYSLAGENANTKNLITGTRYLNQETMQIFELRVLEYLRAHDNHVLYRVTPHFEGDNLLASGVLMEAYSIEDEGKGICFNVYCYNVQPGIDIDYATGESKESETVTSVPDRQIPDDEADVAGTDYIVNKKSGKIHLPSCSGVEKMAEHNKMYYTGTLEELEKMGYVPCKLCKPK